MRYLALCCDYDGTLAHHGRLSAATIESLERLIASGRRLVMVTGRELSDLQKVCERLDLFEYIVAENGALLFRPATREEKPLGEPPPARFVEALRARGVTPLSVGRVIVATWEPHETTVLQTIRDFGLELQVIFNKGAVMVLPAGVNKATGLQCALQQMGLSPHEAIGIGDAENDHAFLNLCECSVAVSNALPLVKEKADIVTTGDHGDGVSELIHELLKDDLASREPRLTRHHVLLGHDDDDQEIRVPPYGSNILLVGTSGSGKSTLATGLLERLMERQYTFCVIDPEGDYEALPDAVMLGKADRAPGVEEAVQLLSKPGENGVFNLVGLPIADRPSYFLGLMPRLQELRARTGRPHWIIVDEAHHLLPADWETGEQLLPERLRSILQITVHPSLIAPAALAHVDTVIAVGATPEAMLKEFSDALGEPPPSVDPVKLETGEALVWFRQQTRVPFRLRIAPSRTERRRHTRKYAEGSLGPDRSFYFRGPEGKLNLRAHNLILFMQLADGVDEDTWVHHLKARDYSQWMRECIKDDTLAEAVERIENTRGLSPAESRRQVREAIEGLYTLPASLPGMAGAVPNHAQSSRSTAP
jgi:hydroxymethylpyrimidine pyrophosphatase-like HAD family hydrolase